MCLREGEEGPADPQETFGWWREGGLRHSCRACPGEGPGVRLRWEAVGAAGLQGGSEGQGQCLPVEQRLSTFLMPRPLVQLLAVWRPSHDIISLLLHGCDAVCSDGQRLSTRGSPKTIGKHGRLHYDSEQYQSHSYDAARKIMLWLGLRTWGAELEVSALGRRRTAPAEAELPAFPGRSEPQGLAFVSWLHPHSVYDLFTYLFIIIIFCFFSVLRWPCCDLWVRPGGSFRGPASSVPRFCFISVLGFVLF